MVFFLLLTSYSVPLPSTLLLISNNATAPQDAKHFSMEGCGESSSCFFIHGTSAASPILAAAAHCGARVSNPGAVSQRWAESPSLLGFTRSGLAFKSWDNIDEFTVNVNINDIAMLLPKPADERASNVDLHDFYDTSVYCPPEAQGPTMPSVGPASTSTPNDIHSQCRKNFKNHLKS